MEGWWRDEPVDGELAGNLPPNTNAMVVRGRRAAKHTLSSTNAMATDVETTSALRSREMCLKSEN